MWGIELNRQGDVPLARQLYQALRDRMTEGSLKPGDLLPSTREAALQLHISRNTATEAYAMLSDEGFIESSQGARTRVAAGLMLGKAGSPPEPDMPLMSHRPAWRADFRTGQPDLGRFPLWLWQKLLKKAVEELPRDQWGYSGPKGLPCLREEIAAWLMRSRGLAVRAQDVFITAGAMQALHLLAGLPALLAGDVLVEDPCHSGMLQAWLVKGARVHPVPVDEHGMRTETLVSLPCGTGMGTVYVTPSHQFPLGGILPAARRAELIRFARKHGMYIIEDDYDSEFRYCGAQVSPLMSMDPARVIYTGTFSKTLFPALRIGYVVLPQELQGQWCAHRQHVDVQNPPFEQAALAEMLRTRKFDRHVQQMRRLYGQRREALLQALREEFSHRFRPWGDASGLHVALQFPGMCFDREFARFAKSHGVCVTPVENHSITKGAHSDKLLLGYGHLGPEDIRRAVPLLGDTLKRWTAHRPPPPPHDQKPGEFI